MFNLDNKRPQDQRPLRLFNGNDGSILRIDGDGNCLFKAVVEGYKCLEIQIPDYLTDHLVLRAKVIQELRKPEFLQVINATLSDEKGVEINSITAYDREGYISKMAKPGIWGGTPELYAIAKILQLQIVVHQAGVIIKIPQGAEFDAWPERLELVHEPVNAGLEQDNDGSVKSVNHYNLALHRELAKQIINNYNDTQEEETELGQSIILASSYKRLWYCESFSDNKFSETGDDLGYLITIPYYAGSSKSIQDIINLFATNAFINCSDGSLAKKISLVIGVNQSSNDEIIDVTPKLPNSTEGYVFDVEVIYFLWDYHKIPYGDICNYINESAASLNLIAKLRKKGCKYIYYAKFDSDTISLNYCFSKYEDAIKEHIYTFKAIPHLLTSGYITKHVDKDPSEHGLELGTEIDYESRKAVAYHLPFVPYFTEANTLIFLPNDDAYLSEKYSQSCEMAGMKKNIITKRRIDPYKHFLFVPGCPVVTEYRSTLINKHKMSGKFKKDRYVNWDSQALKKLRSIWQTHYRDDQVFYKHLKENLSFIFESENNDKAYRSVGGCLEYVVQHIDKCFDPLVIIEKTLPLHIQSSIGRTSDLLEIETEYFEALSNILHNYDDYVGLIESSEKECSKYALYRSSKGIRLQLDEPPKDSRLSDLGDSLWIKQLEEKLCWLLVMYVFKASYPGEDTDFFFQEIEKPEWYYIKWLRKNDNESYKLFLQDVKYTIQSDDTITIKEKIPISFETLLQVITKKLGGSFSDKFREPILNFVHSTIAAAHKKGKVVQILLLNKLELDHSKNVISLLKKSIANDQLFQARKTKKKWSRLHKDILEGKPLVFSLETLSETGKYECNALHLLAISNRVKDLKAVLLFIELNLSSRSGKDAFLDVEMLNGMTPLELAFHFGKKEETALFVDAGADFSSSKRKSLLYKRTLEKESLLHIAAEFCSFASLIKVGSKIKVRRNEPKEPKDLKNALGQTPLHRFLENGNTDVAGLRYLMTNNNFDLADEDEFTPLLIATISDHPEMREVIKILINFGADFAFVGCDTEYSPFEQAVSDGDLGLVHLMLSKKMDLSRFKSIIHFAIDSKNPYKMLDLLLNGLSEDHISKCINARDSFGNAPIHVAIILKRNRLINLLLKFGADLELKNEDSLTPYELANSSNNSEATLGLLNVSFEITSIPLSHGSSIAPLVFIDSFQTRRVKSKNIELDSEMQDTNKRCCIIA